MRMLPSDLDDVESTSLSLQSGILTEIELQNVSKYASKQISKVREDLTWKLLQYMTSFNMFGNGKDGGNQMMCFVMFMAMMFVLLVTHYVFNFNISSAMGWGSSNTNIKPI